MPRQVNVEEVEAVTVVEMSHGKPPPKFSYGARQQPPPSKQQIREGEKPNFSPEGSNMPQTDIHWVFTGLDHHGTKCLLSSQKFEPWGLDSSAMFQFMIVKNGVIDFNEKKDLSW